MTIMENYVQNLQAGEFKAANPLYPVKYLESYRGTGKTDDIAHDRSRNVDIYFANGSQFKGQKSVLREQQAETETFADPRRRLDSAI